jgi:TonB family protein
VDQTRGRPCLSSSRMVFLLASCILVWPLTAAAQERTPQDRPYTVGGGVIPPVILSQPLPAYTDEARAAQVEGIVLLQAVVRKDGTVDNFKVLRGLGYGLDESALSTIATRWRFQPGTFRGQPVDVQVNIAVSFRLYHRPKEAEGPPGYPLRVLIVDLKWDQDSSGETIGSGYGNLVGAGPARGFIYTTDCSPGLQEVRNLPARWIEPESRLEILMASGPKTGVTKPCELKVSMQNALFTLRDGQVVAADPANPNPK